MSEFGMHELMNNKCYICARAAYSQVVPSTPLIVSEGRDAITTSALMPKYICWIPCIDGIGLHIYMHYSCIEVGPVSIILGRDTQTF